MQIEKRNASTWMLATIVLIAQLNWATWACAQAFPDKPNPPTLTTSALQPPNISPIGSQPIGSQPIDATVVTIDPNQLVLNAIHQSVWGPAYACKVHQRSHAYEQQVVVSGEYKTSGIGTGQFRYNARVSSGETTLDTLQVSDGRLMFTQVGLDDPPRRVNLDQVRQSLGGMIHHVGERPDVNFYLAVGGHPELLRSLYHRYFWYKAVAGPIRGVDVWQLVGRLRTEPPKLAGNAPLDQQTFSAPAPSSNLPTEVRLTLGRSASAAYFPYMVEYFRRSKRLDGQPDAELLSVLEHTERTTSVTIVDKDFVFKIQEGVKNKNIDDETALYLPTSPITERPPKVASQSKP